jgi:hypothetical protein
MWGGYGIQHCLASDTDTYPNIFRYLHMGILRDLTQKGVYYLLHGPTLTQLSGTHVS